MVVNFEYRISQGMKQKCSFVPFQVVQLREAASNSRAEVIDIYQLQEFPLKNEYSSHF